MHRLLLASLLLTTTAFAAVDLSQFNEAKALFDQRKLPEAQSAFEKLAAANSKDPEVNFYLGDLARRRGDFDQAAELLLKSTAAAPTVARYYSALGDVHGQAAQKASIFSQPGLAKKCRLAYEKAVELEPTNVNYRRSLLGFYRQAPGIVGGGMDKAYAQAEEIRKLNAAAGRFELAGLYVADKKFPEALALFEEAVKATPDDYGANYQIGRMAALTGTAVDRGLETLKKCLTLTPPADQPPHAAVQWRLGNLWEKKGDKAAARTAYEASLQLDPKFTQAADSLKALK